jgi:16S rRNA processing protein RimM
MKASSGMDNDDYKLVKIAYVAKAHGIDGTVVLRFTGDEWVEADIEEPLFIEIQGIMVPLFMEEIVDAGDHAFVKFELVNSSGEVRKIRNCSVFARLQGPELPASLKGWIFTDKISGKKGEIIEYLEGGMNPLMILSSENKEYHVPANPDFILESDPDTKRIIFNFPEGIFDQD